MEVRLKEDCTFVKISSKYGTVTHEWGSFPDEGYLSKEIEVRGKTEEPKAEVVVEEPKEELVAEPEPVEEPIVEAEPVKVKKKRRKR